MSAPVLVPSNLISWSFFVVPLLAPALPWLLRRSVEIVMSDPSVDQRKHSAATEQNPG
jgi:hypothetical protein